MKRTIYFLFSILLLATVLYACKVGRFVVYNFADINDYKKFPSRTIEKGETSFRFDTTSQGRVPKTLTVNAETHPFESYLEDHKTVAFLIIKEDTIQYENYWRKYQSSSIVPSISMAKSITLLLIGCAIDDGLIHTVNDPVTHYLPDLEGQGFDEITIAHLLQITLGIDFKDSYNNTFGDAATFYYGTNLRKAAQKLKPKTAPGTAFTYVSGNTQLLGLVLERVLQEKTLSAYLEEKIWKPLGMEYDATWSLDRKKDGMEKTFCCINARARDYAKIGRLYLNQGNWNGKQIVSADWVSQSTKIDTTQGSARFYQYQWWLPSPNGDFMAQGILGQYLYVHPKKNLIIVRLGKNEGGADWWSILTGLGEAY